jgi:hypothetical protein
LNIHWFFDKLGMTGTRAQLYNGFLLLFSFFACRLVYGTYESFQVFKDVWAATDAHPHLTSAASGSGLARAATLRFATKDSTVPQWLALSYLASNITLNTLNFYWFIMMIKAVRKRFVPVEASEIRDDKTKVVIASGAQPMPSKLRNRTA